MAYAALNGRAGATDIRCADSRHLLVIAELAAHFERGIGWVSLNLEPKFAHGVLVIANRICRHASPPQCQIPPRPIRRGRLP